MAIFPDRLNDDGFDISMGAILGFLLMLFNFMFVMSRIHQGYD